MTQIDNRDVHDPKPPEEAAVLDRIVRVARMLDIYGELLTERQRDFLKLHFEEDMSFSEIAEEYKVSRQAVHDAVKHGIDSLQHYEDKLRLLERELAAESPGAAAAATSATPQVAGSVRRRLGDLHDRIRRSGGILYDTSGIERELASIIQEIDASAGPAPQGS